MTDGQDMTMLKKYSADNIARLRTAAGTLGVEILPVLMEKHASMFRMDFFHETSAKNIPAIRKSKAVYSFDELKRRGKKNAAGMTIAQGSTSEIFNNVNHAADAFTDYVYGRAVFGGIKMGGMCVLWPKMNIREDMWFCFEDPNQLTLADKELIEWGMTVAKGFTSFDAYVGRDFPEAIALRALSNVAQIEYLGRFKKYGYDKQAAFHAVDDIYTKPDEEMNMDFAKAMKYYEGIALEPDSAYRAYSNACGGYDPAARKAEMKAAGLELSYGQPPVVTEAIRAHPDFEKCFVDSCRAIFQDIARSGQVAVAKSISLKGAVMPVLTKKEVKKENKPS